MNKKVLFFLTGHSQLGATGRPTGYYLSEVSHAYFEFTSRHISVDFATIKGGQAPMDPASFDLTDSINTKFVALTSVMKQLSQALPLKRLVGQDYQGIYFPGGHGTVFDLPNDQNLAALITDIYTGGGIIGAVCHGPSALLNVKLPNGKWLVSGRRINSFTNEEEVYDGLENIVPFLLESELIARGAIFEKSGIQEPKVVVDGHIITGQNPASAMGLGQAMANLMVGTLK